MESEVALALNRYLATSVLPLLTDQADFFFDSDHASALLDSLLHTVYRLSKVKSLTKNQIDAVSAFLLAFTRCVAFLRCFPRSTNICLSVAGNKEFVDTCLKRYTVNRKGWFFPGRMHPCYRITLAARADLIISTT